jgi:hypothetical protein
LSALPIADLDVDVMDQLDPEHDGPPLGRSPSGVIGSAAHESSSARRARVKPLADLVLLLYKNVMG